MTPKQKKILNFLRSGPKKKAEIVEEFKGWYYGGYTHIAQKYIGEILQRLVKSRQLKQPKKGWYELNYGRKDIVNKSGKVENQLEIF